jgi:hypothetical protein
MIPTFVPGALAADTSPAALADAVLRLTGAQRPTLADFEKSWHARCAALDPAEVGRQWVEALNR